MADKYNEEGLIKKLQDGKEITKGEELFYLTSILDFSEAEAERIIAIANNTNKNIIID